ncbi:arginase [Nitritalea halalkaliphila LW7]|uniref:Arginase n=1 Tax=Nitritalea halalkaliphila LW7 TaxID=1189621 RepID=I5C7T6_9BACT|nr:formimidoylglutamase [Nitritalea halalkaliphila]EIM77888.1 arginase [Nitritalea halalkaliphila LW7]
MENFFYPISEELTQLNYHPRSFYAHIYAHTGFFPDLSHIDVVLIGLTEARGAQHNQSMERGTFEIREKLYRLMKHDTRIKVADLGDLIPGDTLEETYARIAEVGQRCLEKQLLPVFFGGSHDLDIGQYRAYEGMNKMVSLLTVDAKVDMEEITGEPCAGHTQQIVLHEPNFLFSSAHIAYQRYLNDPDLLMAIEKLNFDLMRLGELRADISEVEPLLRQTDLVSFDLCAIQAADAPGVYDAQAFGLTATEACQLARFAGSSEKLSSFGLYGYQPYYDDAHNRTAQVAAVMLWYFIDGFYEREHNLSFDSVDYMKYTVSLDTKGGVLTFIKASVPTNGGWKFRRRS